MSTYTSPGDDLVRDLLRVRETMKSLMSKGPTDIVCSECVHRKMMASPEFKLAKGISPFPISEIELHVRPTESEALALSIELHGKNGRRVMFIPDGEATT